LTGLGIGRTTGYQYNVEGESPWKRKGGNPHARSMPPGREAKWS